MCIVRLICDSSLSCHDVLPRRAARKSSMSRTPFALTDVACRGKHNKPMHIYIYICIHEYLSLSLYIYIYTQL